MMEVELWTDGSSTGAVGDGGWAYILRCGDKLKEESGWAADTTNNRMEMTALLMGLRALKRPGCDVRVFTDSEYVMKPFTENWLGKWEAKGWHKGRMGLGAPVANADIWKALKIEAARHFVTFQWVPGHKGVLLNERCDELAKAAKLAGQQMSVEIDLPDGYAELEFSV